MMTQDAVCPRCGSLLWFGQIAEMSAESLHQRFADMPHTPETAAQYWEHWEPSTLHMLFPREPLVVTATDVRSWEAAHGFQLPRSLARAMSAQNGGRLRWTAIDIYPLGLFANLDQGEWAEVALTDLPAAERQRMLRVGTMPGGRLILDFRRAGEPRARNMDHIFDGELRADYASFDLLVRSSQRQSAQT